MKDDTRYIDFGRVEDEAMHMRLVNWARYVRDHPNMWPVQPMFRHVKTSRQWDISPHIKIEVDQIDGLRVEKIIRTLPDKNRDALRWYYVYSSITVLKMRKYLGLTNEGLNKAVCDGRTMLKNNLHIA
jgi:hypothetical protein